MYLSKLWTDFDQLFFWGGSGGWGSVFFSVENISSFFRIFLLFFCYHCQWLKCHRTEGNTVPPPPMFSARRSLTSNFQQTLRFNRISAYCALNFCTVLPFLRLDINVKDVNVNAWLPDNEVNLVVSEPATTNRDTRGPKLSIRGPQPPTGGQNLNLQFPHLCISTLTTDHC